MNNNELVYLCREDETKLDRYLSSGLISIAQYNQVKMIISDEQLKQMALISYQADNPHIIDALQKKEEVVEEEVKELDNKEIIADEQTPIIEEQHISNEEEGSKISKEDLMQSILGENEPEYSESYVEEDEKFKSKKTKRIIGLVVLIAILLAGGIVAAKLILSPKEQPVKQVSSKSSDDTSKTDTKKDDASDDIADAESSEPDKEEMVDYTIEPQTLTDEQVAQRDRLISNSEIKASDISDDLITEFVEGVDPSNVTATYLAITPNKNYYIANLGGEQNDTLIMEITKENGEVVADNGFTSEKLAYMANESDEIGQTYNMDYPEAVRNFKDSIDDNQNQYNTLESEYNKLKYDRQLFMIKEDDNSKVTSLSSKLNVIDGYMYNKNIAILNSDGSKYESNIIADSNDLGLFGITSSDEYKVKDVLNSFFNNSEASVNYVPIDGSLAELGGDLSSSTFYYDEATNQLLLFDASLDNVTDDSCADVKYHTIDLDEAYVISNPTKGKYILNIQDAVDKATDGEMSKSDADACTPISNAKITKDLIDSDGWTSKITEL